MNREAVIWMRSFLEKEHDARVASALEQKLDSFRSVVQAVNDLFSGDLDSGIVRPDNVDEAYFAERAQQIAANAPRKLFLVRQYQHSKHGLVSCNYTSTERIKGKSYFAKFCVAQIDNKWRVISRYLINDNHTNWDWNGGVRFRELGDFVGVERFQSPTNPSDREDYESDEGTIS